GQVPAHPGQVVHDVAAGHDEDPATPQAGQPGAEVEVVVEVLVGVDGQLHDRDVGVGEGVHQDRPGAVVDAPGVDVSAHPGRVDRVADLGGELGQPRRGVLDGEQF